MKTYAVAPRGVLGSFSRNHLGYRFIPFCQHQPSRKHWLTPASALPRWARDATIVQAEDAVQALAAFTATPPKSWRVEVIADNSGKWVGNGLVFATAEEAGDYGLDLASRWTLVRDWRVVEVPR